MVRTKQLLDILVFTPRFLTCKNKTGDQVKFCSVNIIFHVLKIFFEILINNHKLSILIKFQKSDGLDLNTLL